MKCACKNSSKSEFISTIILSWLVNHRNQQTNKTSLHGMKGSMINGFSITARPNPNDPSFAILYHFHFSRFRKDVVDAKMDPSLINTESIFNSLEFIGFYFKIDITY